MKPVRKGRTSVSSRAAAGAFTLLLTAGCASNVRMDTRFDADALGTPSSTPAPSPPADVLSWTVTQQLTSTVEANPAGGRWLHIVPDPTFVASPDARRRALIATTEKLTTSPPATLRGHLRLRLNGRGLVSIGLQGAQGSDILGGFAVGSYALPNPPRGEVILLGEFSVARIENDLFGLPSRGKLGPYQPGTLISIHWSIDQASRTFSASMDGGKPQSTTFAATSGGVATTPLPQLGLYVWVERPSADMSVFIDELHVEEVR